MNHMLQQKEKIQQVAVLYSRVSSTEQAKEGFSIPAQLKLLKSYADENNLSILHEFIDVETAKQAGRTGFGKMISFLKESSTCRIILVEKTDRLYRNIKDWVLLDDMDLEIHFVKEGVILSKDSRSSEKFMHGIKVLMAKNYIDNLSEETKKGLLQKAEEGMPPTRAALGYKNVMGLGGKRTIEPDERVMPLIQKVFEWYASGNYSLLEVRTLAHESGLAYRKSGKPLGKSDIDHILRNPIYYGDFFYSGKLYRGKHQPIITKELWDAAQAVRVGRHKPQRRDGVQTWAFQGLLNCGHCGCLLTAEIKKGKYIYYHCTGHKKKCPEKYVREETLAEQFGEYLKGLVIDDEVLTWLKTALHNSHKDEEQFHKEAIEGLQEQYNRLQSRLDRMYEDRLDGKIEVDFYESKSAEWRQEKADILRKIQVHEKADKNYMDQGIKILELAQTAYKLYQRQVSSEKRRLLNFVFSNSTFKDGKIQPTFRKPFDSLIETNVVYKQKKAVNGDIHDLRPIWGQFDNSFRNFFRSPSGELSQLASAATELMAA